MNKTKIYKISAIALLILNIGFMVFPMIVGRPNHNPQEMIIKKLNFNKDQVLIYDELIATHVKKINNLEQDILTNKELLYNQLINTNPLYNDSIMSVIGSKHIEIEKTHFNHFKEIKKLCKTKEQTEAFNSLIKELKNVFSNRPKRMRH